MTRRTKRLVANGIAAGKEHVVAANGILYDLEHRLPAVGVERHAEPRDDTGIRGAGGRGREELLGVILREGYEVGDLLSLQGLDLQELSGLHFDRLPLSGVDVTRPDRRFLTQQVAQS